MKIVRCGPGSLESSTARCRKDTARPSARGLSRRAWPHGHNPVCPVSLIVAHRGYVRAGPENTLSALLAAAVAGADAVEVDVRLTADGTPVLHHDITLQRIWGLPWPVHALSADRLRRKVPQVPTLREALEVMLPYGVPLVLDLRSSAAARAALNVVRQVRPRRTGTRRLMHASNPRGPQVDPRVWFCGTPHSLLALRRADPTLTLMLTWRGPVPPRPSLLRALAPALFNPWHVLLSEDLVDRWHRRGIGVSTWTVDDPDRLASLHLAGVDAVITNDLVAALRGRRDDGSGEVGGHREADYLAS